jgi:hypothetical protein
MENRQTIHSSRNAVIEAQVAAPSCKTWPLREKNDITGSIRCDARRDDQTALSYFGHHLSQSLHWKVGHRWSSKSFATHTRVIARRREFACAFRNIGAYHSINTNC